MTVNDLIENFRINVEDGGVLITDKNGYSCSLTKICSNISERMKFLETICMPESCSCVSKSR